MKRRALILGIAGAAMLPGTLCAQQKAIPVIGFLGSTSLEAIAPFVTAFRRGLQETGYVEGRNVELEFRWAQIPTVRLTLRHT